MTRRALIETVAGLLLFNTAVEAVRARLVGGRCRP
jgi:hypothetical protein